MNLKKIEKLPLEELKIEALKIIKKCQATNDRELDMITMVTNAVDKNRIIIFLWNLLLSGEGLGVIDSEFKPKRYNKQNKRFKKKKLP